MNLACLSGLLKCMLNERIKRKWNKISAYMAFEMIMEYTEASLEER